MKNLITWKLFILILIVTSCASTKIVESWKEPDKQITIDKLKKVLVVAMFKDETSNRKAEDQMVKFLKDKGIPSYNYLNKNFDKTKVEVIQNKIKKDGFDGAVTMRLIDVDKETIYQRNGINRFPNNYRDFSNYYYDSAISYYNPDNYITTKTYTIETNIYSITENKIIWSALTETSDPKGVNKMTEEVTQVVYKQMIKDGLIK
ncbi:hypothetical protein [Flavobacterium sp.]|uniref:hypothetical protein n=1 Tax=Flavobacterium sp. TaxID=239 RepID=UPI00286AFA76|nr:hypothetical protein [Flavobacterium sp.]